MLIGMLSSSSGFSRDTIRYYEKLGLLESADAVRRGNNYKEYSPRALERLNHIGQLKSLGFTLTEIKDLFYLSSVNAKPCKDIPKQLDQKLGVLRQKIAILEGYEEKLSKVRRTCNTECGLSNGLPSCFQAQES